MKISKKDWPLSSVYGIRKRINTNPDFQRPAVWGLAQKQLLIDTILRDYDVPKLYWRKTGSKPDTYDVVDGQQRLRTIWAFFNNEFKLPKDADDIDGELVVNLSYSDLPDELRIKFDTYNLNVVMLEDTDEDEVREMFLRLQNGTTLKAQEKRNAYPGKMRNYVHKLATHDFFKKVGFANKRFTYDLVAAQLVCLEQSGGPTNIKNADLNKMYKEGENFDEKLEIAKAVERTLKQLNEIFSEKTPELERYNVISLYCVLRELQQEYVLSEIKDKLFDWFIKFEQKRRQNDKLPEDQADPEWLAYKDKTTHSTDSFDSIKWRMEFMLRNLLEKYPKLSRKDNQRNFTHLQKLAVFRRDNGLCQLKLKCNGKKLTWDNWECDHIKPWSKGGLTTVENGQVACPECNVAKGGDK
ncbi:DUF262 domain-containing protein [Candidatus Woesearchaeota archaeon]|nr:DUF262 domain-containing protein [Candidatus Woesearchaeota archaeon]